MISRLPRAVVSLLLALLFALATGAAFEGSGRVYVCPPCGAACHHLRFDAPGRCPVCGMTLVEEKSVVKAAILLFPGVEIIDYSGPYEVFGQAGIQVYTVAEKSDALTTAMGLSVNPGFTFDNIPPVDILVVPGGHVDAVTGSPAAMAWIKRCAADADYVLSVCNGAFVLAEAGLLDGLKATTFYRLIDKLRSAAPKATVVSDQRYVDNGKIITSAGLSSGMDASLHLLSRLYGRGRAEQIALHLEYDWRPESNFARAALADRLLEGIWRPAGMTEWAIESTRGTRDQWRMIWQATSSDSLDTVVGRLNDALQQREGWTMDGSSKHGDARGSAWIVRDPQGGRWKGSLSVEPKSPNRFHIAIAIDRLPPANTGS